MNISLSPEILFHIGSFAVSNALLWSFFISAVLMVIALIFGSRLKEVPGRVQGLIEIIVGGAFDFVRSIIGSDRKARRIFPLVFSMFVFTLISNLFTYIPGQSALSVRGAEGTVPLFRAVMSDYGQVFMMTILTVVLVQIVTIVVHGPFGYLGKFINLKGIFKFFAALFRGQFRPGDFFQGFLDLFLGLMDIVGELAKIFSLSFRLFGNIFAGEVLTAVILFLAPFFVPLPFMFLGLLTAVVQAFVFSILTLIFVTMASEIEEDQLAEQSTM
ncbi:hypothetical protein A2303_04180 [Candidatus Falkowbacteria bacterium RIFOXYB2_FULL_47_14]|uniref:ATP synthase subunit a n=1 Tax=Candidatus Falkowbacteria bacterium RIFOXYA2_FULL_47_19 TaxID=1797994 RepID=A0A1F5SK24_9BACT|nr:MAG: hypothetical protein A2227_04100 [Candidatus Falkowbacteria bacterium RIFOXYA2_FULL_47_19]OGF35370.1 MAG: hypothetical protein A2468_02270 [Candidatus Falkowbacteria bacterium RIFOXYC2_FULL_46_15]OGF43097.1 MAG: hypothetical protein A2303_04180 [Candidatus Falkowbacteria bacterium RIFOXYB2_FULL_47_14]